MQLTVLTDNNTYIDEYYVGEPGLSYYIEEGKEKILFDTGYSDVFLHNAKALGINIAGITRLVFSHGHNDHTRGLMFLHKTMDLSKIPVTTHPDCFLPKRHDGLQVGAPFDEAMMDKLTKLELTAEPVWLTDKLVYLGEIPRIHDWEKRLVVGEVCCDGEWKEDIMEDDSALAYKSKEGVFVITGCSHSGICNIVSRALAVCDDKRLRGIIGGMHLMKWDQRAEATVKFLLHQYNTNLVDDFGFYPAHCTGFVARAEMYKSGLPVRDVWVGLKIEL